MSSLSISTIASPSLVAMALIPWVETSEELARVEMLFFGAATLVLLALVLFTSVMITTECHAAKVERLRTSSPIEILQQEIAEMKRQMSSILRTPEPEALHLREELATACAEIAALKSVVGDLIALRHENPRGGAICSELNAMRGQGLFERLGVPAYFVTTVNGNQLHRSVPIDWQKYAEMDWSHRDVDGLTVKYPTLV